MHSPKPGPNTETSISFFAGRALCPAKLAPEVRRLSPSFYAVAFAPHWQALKDEPRLADAAADRPAISDVPVEDRSWRKQRSVDVVDLTHGELDIEDRRLPIASGEPRSEGL